MIRFLPALFPVAATVLVGLFGCTSESDQPTAADVGNQSVSSTDTASSPRPAPTSDQSNPVTLAGQTFHIKSFPLGADAPTDGPPKVAIYMYPSQSRDSVLIAQDTKPSQLERDRGPKLGVPKEAVILFQTYYAGAGYYYYAVTERNQLRVYRKLLEEASPENERTPLPQWQLFKLFSFFSDGVRQQPTDL